MNVAAVSKVCVKISRIDGITEILRIIRFDWITVIGNKLC